MMMFTYDQNAALKAGQSGGISTGEHVLLIEQAEWRNYNGNESLNFTLVNESGSKAFVDLRYKGSDGKEWTGNIAHIQAIQGLLGGINLTSTQVGDAYIAQELTGRKVGMVIQKRLFTKSNGEEGFSMQLVMAFDPQTKQTLKEKVKGEQAKAVSVIMETLEDKDDRKPSQGGAQGGYQQSAPQNNNQPPVDAYSDMPNW